MMMTVRTIRRASLWIAAAAPLFVFACSNKSQAPAQEDSDFRTGNPIGNGNGADSGSTTTNPTVDAATADSGDEPPPGPSRCDVENEWPDKQDMPTVSLGDGDRFCGMTADELTVTWVDSAGAVHVADRSLTTEDFGASTRVYTAASLGTDPAGRVTLTANSKTMIGVAADRKSLKSFHRDARDTAFVETQSLVFANINATLVEAGGEISNPLLGSDSKSLFYIAKIGLDAPPVLYESRWDVAIGGWGRGKSLPNPEFQITDSGHLRRATGAAADGRTLFFFDEVSGIERAAWRDRVTSDFNVFVDLPGLTDATTDTDCQRLYFKGASAGQGAVYFAE